jgi:hypothetical protein
VILISAFSILILIFNPVLLWLFKKLEISPQKFQFWVMVSTGIAWLASLASFLIKPDQTLNLFWDVGSTLMPGSIFTLDDISSTLLLAINSIIFAGILFQEYTAQEHAWISGLGGICSLGLLADSPFTVLLVLTLVEIILLVNFLSIPTRSETIRRRLMAVIFRTLGPFLILFASLLSGYQSSEGTFSSLDPAAAPLLIAAGLLSSAGWSAVLKTGEENFPGLIPRPFSELLPGSVGLMVIIRGGEIITTRLPLSYELILAGAALTFALLGYLFRKPRLGWTLSVLGIIAGAALSGAIGDSLTWSLVFLLPGFLLTKQPANTSQNLLFLMLGGIGIISLPFFPVWSGANLFHPGLPGYLFAGAFGLAGGALVRSILESIQKKELSPGPLNLPFAFGAVCPLLAQFLIALASGLIPKSLGLKAYAVSAWIPGLVMLAAIFIKIGFPERMLASIERFSDYLEPSTSRSIAAGRNLMDRIITFLADIFEGEGGLIWALLIAFLIGTLINLGGG